MPGKAEIQKPLKFLDFGLCRYRRLPGMTVELCNEPGLRG